MAWFGEPDPAAELEAKIEEATSESIPNGELDIAVGLEITDMIRSKNVPAKTAMRCLKKRLTKVYNNPNLLMSTLKLTDLCVKNCGGHFVVEINAKEFVDYLVDYILKVHYDVKSYQVYSSEAKFSVGNQILKLIKEWTLYFQNQESNYLGKQYQMLVRQGYEFPEVDPLISQGAANFIDSEAPPDWIDGKECMICYTPFSVMNRKHHCRACGSVFCQTHSSNNIPLVSLGIMQPVRVCDDCYQIHKSRNSEARNKKPNTRNERSAQPKDDEDEQIRKAIELSLKDTQIALSYVAPPPPQAQPQTTEQDEEMDDDLRAAIAASLQDTQPQNYGTQYGQNEGNSQSYEQPYGSGNQAPSQQQTQPQEPELDFYLNIMPDFNAYNSGGQNQFGQAVSNMSTGQSQFEQNQYGQNQYGENQYGQNNFAQQGPAQVASLVGKPGGNQFGQNQPGQSTQGPPETVTPTQHIAQHNQVEDLTPQEEDDINLFIQLMNGVKNDRAKQASIIYDKDLGDLHGRVTQLKPKVNRALRNAIEKYEFFLDMNNKISTISRLYDQYLETKLNQAYSKHYVTSPPGGEAYVPGQSRRSSGAYRSQRSDSYVAPEATGPQYGQAPNAPVYSMQQQASGGQFGQPQNTGGQFRQAQTTGGLYGAPHRAGTQMGEPPKQSVPLGQLNQQQTTGQFNPPKFAGYQPTGLMPYPMEDGPSYLTNNLASNAVSKPDYSPSEPEYEPSKPDYDTPEYGGPSEPKYGDVEQSYPGRALVPSQGNFYPSEPQPDYLGEQSLYPSFPEYPKESEPGSAPGEEAKYPVETDEVSDAESVASRYPPVAGFSDEEVDTDAAATKHASMRYPEVDDLNRVDQLPEMPTLSRLDTTESKKYKSEPEPLIEL